MQLTLFIITGFHKAVQEPLETLTAGWRRLRVVFKQDASRGLKKRTPLSRERGVELRVY